MHPGKARETVAITQEREYDVALFSLATPRE
jgi:hypothetical protein